MEQKRLRRILIFGILIGLLYMRGIPPRYKIFPRWETREYMDTPDSELLNYLITFDQIRIPQRKGATIQTRQFENREINHIFVDEWAEIRLIGNLDYYYYEPEIGHQLFIIAENKDYSINDFHSFELQSYDQYTDLTSLGEESSLKCAFVPFRSLLSDIPPETRCELIVRYESGLVSKIDVSNREEMARHPLNRAESSAILIEKVEIIDQKLSNFTD